MNNKDSYPLGNSKDLEITSSELKQSQTSLSKVNSSLHSDALWSMFSVLVFACSLVSDFVFFS